MRRAAHHAKPAMTRMQGRIAMSMFLYGCRPGQLAAVEPDMLVRWHKVTLKEATEELAKAKATRLVML